MAYKYRAYTTDKKIVQGKIDVATENLAESALYNAGYRNVLSLVAVEPAFKIENLIPSLYGVKTREVIDISNQLATLIQSGITILASLRLLEGQTARKSLKKVLAGLAEDIQGGNSLSQALMRYPKVFTNTFCQVVKASEQAGTLEIGLKQAATYLEKQANARQKLTRAMAYPIFVMIMAVGVCILLSIVALPPMVALFSSFNAELPWTTKMLTLVATFVLNNRMALLIGIIVFALAVFTAFRIPVVQLFKDKLILKIPIIGSIAIERSMSMFCQTAAMLLKAGLRLPSILDIVIQTNKNRVLCQLFTKVRESLVQGAGLSQPMSQNKLFPQLLVEMVMVGEKTGVMDTTLATLANFYEIKADRKIDTLISMIEPALTVAIGGVVVFIALSVITPMYSILKSI